MKTAQSPFTIIETEIYTIKIIHELLSQASAQQVLERRSECKICSWSRPQGSNCILQD